MYSFTDSLLPLYSYKRNYKTINRKYRDQYNGYHLVHFVCQEGYLKMLEFMIDPNSHSEFDDNELEVCNNLIVIIIIIYYYYYYYYYYLSLL